MSPGGWWNADRSSWVKLGLAAAAFATIASRWWRSRGAVPSAERGELAPPARLAEPAGPASSRATGRMATIVLRVLGALSLLAYFNFGAFHFTGFVHLWDTFHHYLGAKYFDELGYDGLYDCVAIADAQHGLDVRARPLTDLRTNQVITAAELLANPERCRARFTPERWEAFRTDVAFFRRRFSPADWQRAQTDHGFNASPVWALVAHPLAGAGALSWRRLWWLAVIDPVLLLGALAAVGWGFGANAAALVAIVLGTYFPCALMWTGGSFLRWDWLAALLAGLSLVRRGRQVTGGALLGYAALSRVFPLYALVGPLMAVGRLWVLRRRAPPEHVRVLLGAALAAALLMPAASLARRPHGWGDFVGNLRKHDGVASTNRMGLPVVLAFNSATTLSALAGRIERTDLRARWETAQAETLAGRRWLWIGLFGLAVAGLAVAVRDQPSWAAAALGLTLIPFGPALACYYYAFAAVPMLLAARRRETAVVLSGLVLASAIVSHVAHLSNAPDEQYHAQSLLVVVALAFVLSGFVGRTPPGANQPPDPVSR